MKHRADNEFWDCYEALPEAVRRTADKAYQQLKADPRHPSLHLKKVGRFWSARVGRNYRALAFPIDDGLYWTWIGNHDDYVRMIKS